MEHPTSCTTRSDGAKMYSVPVVVPHNRVGGCRPRRCEARLTLAIRRQKGGVRAGTHPARAGRGEEIERDGLRRLVAEVAPLAFRVAVKEGKVSFTARALKGASR